MKILITGINSALGNAVADLLRGHQIIGLGRKAQGKYPTLVYDLLVGVPSLPTVDICLHLAFITDPKYCKEHCREAYQVNVLGTAALMKCARRFVFVSTGYVYGFRGGVLTEDLEANPSDDYAAMKLVAEQEAAKHANAVVLRYFFPYGPTMKPASLVNRLIGNIAVGKEVDLHENGSPRTNPIYISDLAEATKVFCLGNQNGIINVGGNEVVSIKELAEIIGERLGKLPVFRHSGKHIKDMVGSTDRLRKEFAPAIELKDGLTRTIDYLMGKRHYQEAA